MKREIVHVADRAQRQVLTPHLERYHEARDGLMATAAALRPGLLFDPDGYWYRMVPEEAEKERPFNVREVAGAGSNGHAHDR